MKKIENYYLNKSNNIKNKLKLYNNTLKLNQNNPAN